MHAQCTQIHTRGWKWSGGCSCRCHSSWHGSTASSQPLHTQARSSQPPGGCRTGLAHRRSLAIFDRPVFAISLIKRALYGVQRCAVRGCLNADCLCPTQAASLLGPAEWVEQCSIPCSFVVFLHCTSSPLQLLAITFQCLAHPGALQGCTEVCNAVCGSCCCKGCQACASLWAR